jgi:hypothetical protein
MHRLALRIFSTATSFGAITSTNDPRDMQFSAETRYKLEKL